MIRGPGAALVSSHNGHESSRPQADYHQRRFYGIQFANAPTDLLACAHVYGDDGLIGNWLRVRFNREFGDANRQTPFSTYPLPNIPE